MAKLHVRALFALFCLAASTEINLCENQDACLQLDDEAEPHVSLIQKKLGDAEADGHDRKSEVGEESKRKLTDSSESDWYYYYYNPDVFRYWQEHDYWNTPAIHSGCQHAKAPTHDHHGATCGSRIKWVIENKHMNFRQAVCQVIDDQPDECGRECVMYCTNSLIQKKLGDAEADGHDRKSEVGEESKRKLTDSSESDWYYYYYNLDVFRYWQEHDYWNGPDAPSGCRHEKAPTHDHHLATCGSRIQWVMDNYHKNFRDATCFVYKEEPQKCRQCRPYGC